MTFQYYNTLKNKSKENLVLYLDEIVPQFTKMEISLILDDIEGKGLSKSNSNISSIKNFYKYEDSSGEFADYSDFKADELEKLYKIYVSHEISNKKAVKWRFFKNMKYTREFTINTLHINRDKNQTKRDLDYIIETESGDIIFVVCYDVLELDVYLDIITKLTEFSQEQGIIPSEIIIAANRTYRNIPINEKVTIKEKSIEPQIWIEWVELDRAFNADDLLIVSAEEELNIAGYNFSTVEDLLDYIYNYTDGGQISIYKQIGYFAESIKKEQQELELIWKGIMIKNNL
jgi:hypothetical protein